MRARSYLLLSQERAMSPRSSISSSESMVSRLVLVICHDCGNEHSLVVWVIDQLHAILRVHIVLLVVRAANPQCHHQKVRLGCRRHRRAVRTDSRTGKHDRNEAPF